MLSGPRKKRPTWWPAKWARREVQWHNSQRYLVQPTGGNHNKCPLGSTAVVELIDTLSVVSGQSIAVVEEELPFEAGDLAGKGFALRAPSGVRFAHIDEAERVPSGLRS